jgi:hypothetical protein
MENCKLGGMGGLRGDGGSGGDLFRVQKRNFTKKWKKAKKNGSKTSISSI